MSTLVNTPVIVMRAKNCYNAYSPDVDGCFATGRTVAEVIVRFQRAAAASIRKMIDDGKPVDNDCVVVTMVALDVPDRLPEDAAVNPVDRLRAFRKQLECTQRELAKQWEVTPETISEWERGKRDIPGPVRALLPQG